MNRKDKCVHYMDTKGHGKPWCNMHRREADCDDCKVGIITRCTPFSNVGVSADAAYGRQVVHNRSESMRRWVDGCWPQLIADADYMALEKRAGVTKVHDDFLVDLEKWVDLYEVGELVRHKGKLARVMKVTGPLVTLKYRARTYTVMDWEIEKTGPINWIKKMWRKRKK